MSSFSKKIAPIHSEKMPETNAKPYLTPNKQISDFLMEQGIVKSITEYEQADELEARSILMEGLTVSPNIETTNIIIIMFLRILSDKAKAMKSEKVT